MIIKEYVGFFEDKPDDKKKDDKNDKKPVKTGRVRSRRKKVQKQDPV